MPFHNPEHRACRVFSARQGRGSVRPSRRLLRAGMT